ncbi:MAG: helicase-related protein [Propionibacteriaceae bacterium]|nr:helicase-related protein [Propionibacteriaceae bacterium]
MAQLAATLEVAPGSVVVVRDEVWLVTQARSTSDGLLIQAQGLSELVKGQSAQFYESLDHIEVLDPRKATVRGDDSPGYRDARLWLEATVRKTPLPLTDDHLTVSTDALADQLSYQHTAVRRALSPEALRPRLLIADAVGLGKTLEIGMILSELIRRGRGDRILIVCPRHVLEQMQHEMWTRFAIPFVRLDSIGVQRVKQKLPATRNPFTYFSRVIISMDTLKQDRFSHDLRKHKWDAVVIDESHNVTNSATQNNRLARILAPTTDALLLASATPHNGNAESFAELIRLLEPTAVSPQGLLDKDDVARLVIRRHRHSDEVAKVVGADWAERKPIQHRLIDASPDEDAVAHELAEVWLYPRHGSSPYSGKGKLFQWVLAKAFLSSPAAFAATVRERLSRVDGFSPAEERERDALRRLLALNEPTHQRSSKYDALVEYLKGIGVGKASPMRAVVFSERVQTLHYLRDRLRKSFGFKPEQVQLLHGGLSDVEQQDIVESFKQAHSPIRVLVTGDVASEGVNLHKQCHEMIHYDIPWSLIRIEQRNGRIDRYGQLTPPQITTLLLSPSTPRFSGDIRVLTRLVDKEAEAHRALGDAAMLMGCHSVRAEEDAIAAVLAGESEFDDVVRSPIQLSDDLDFVDAFFADLAALPAPEESPVVEAGASSSGLYAADVDFLREALLVAFPTPHAPVEKGGVEWREHPQDQTVEFRPPADLRQRLEVLPQAYLKDRGVTEVLRLAVTKQKGKQLLADALTDASDSTWPTAHYLSPLHPVLDWAADRALASLARNEVFAVRGDVDEPHVLLVGTLTNRHGQTVAVSWVDVQFPNSDNPTFALPEVRASARELFEQIGFGSEMINPGALDTDRLQAFIEPAVAHAEVALEATMAYAKDAAEQRIKRWSARTSDWQERAAEVAQRELVRNRRMTVAQEQQVIEDMRPTRRLVRPLLVVVPDSFGQDR